MATHGSVSEFVQSVESWTSYVQRLEQYFAANDIAVTEATAAKREAILLASVGATTFDLIRSLLTPKAVATFAAELRKLTENCDFKDNLDE